MLMPVRNRSKEEGKIRSREIRKAGPSSQIYLARQDDKLLTNDSLGS
jgi:hypothetical protein